jgi:hypothetical protein
MADDRLPLLRGRITSVDGYEAPQRGRGSSSALPSRDPNAHRTELLRQLDIISQKVNARDEAARDELATREIVAVRPASSAELAPQQLDHSSDARLVGVIPDTGVVVLDVAKANLDHLRKKLDDYVDDSKVRVKSAADGTTISTRRANERAVAPIASIGLADLDDLGGIRFRSELPTDDRAHWFEIACRGGYRNPLRETEGSRAQITRQLNRIGAGQKLDDFVAPEQVYFFVRLTRTQLAALHDATDCIYEVELAPQPIRDMKLLDDIATGDVADFVLTQPHADAPSVVVLDTGIATRHPLLSTAILSATTAGPEIPSPEDTYGHGTKMAGLALFRDLGAAIESGQADATHWLQSSRLLVQPGRGTASDENYEKWPILTERAVRSAEDADPRPRDRVFVLAVTRTMQEPPLDGLLPTLWSQAVDQLAYHDGHGRLIIVSAGNARDGQWLRLAEQHPQLQLSEKIHQPAQASNVLTVGAFTARVELPKDADHEEARLVAKRPGGISPFTSTGLVGNEWPIKPDVVFEGGNLALTGPLPNATIPTLSALTTSHRHTLGQPIGLISMTSEASARGAFLAARVWSVEPKLWPESVRGLIVHSASWTKAMREDFRGLSDRLLACGYGVPDEQLATACAVGIATIVIEDSMPNASIENVAKQKKPKKPATKTTEPKVRRKVKLFRLPMPASLSSDADPDVELRVTLSYFAEPNKFGRRVYHGLDLKWDMQGPQESEKAFLQRINSLMRPLNAAGKRMKVAKTKSFRWEVGIQNRSRGTVQSDRWRGKMSSLVGDKLVAIVPVFGWWDQRQQLKTQEMDFSLVVSVFGPGVYAAIKPRIEAETPITIDV